MYRAFSSSKSSHQLFWSSCTIHVLHSRSLPMTDLNFDLLIVSCNACNYLCLTGCIIHFLVSSLTQSIMLIVMMASWAYPKLTTIIDSMISFKMLCDWFSVFVPLKFSTWKYWVTNSSHPPSIFERLHLSFSMHKHPRARKHLLLPIFVSAPPALLLLKISVARQIPLSIQEQQDKDSVLHCQF